MSKYKKDSYVDLEFAKTPAICSVKAISYLPKIKPFVLYKGASLIQRDYIRQKRVKNYKALYEEESYPEQLSFARRRHLYLHRSHYKKQTRKLSIMFLPIDALLKIMKHVSSKYSGLTSLNIALKEVIKQESLERVAKHIARLSRLKSLTLNFYQRQLKLKGNSLMSFEKSLSKLKGLVHINLSFTENKIYLFEAGLVPVGSIFDEKDQNLELFSNMYARLTNLNSIKLTVMEQNTLTGNELSKFSRNLLDLKSLTNLYLNFLDCRSLYFKDIDRLLTNLALLPHLNTLGLAFTIFENVGKGKLTPSLHPIWQQNNIQHVTLEIKFIAVFSTEVMDALIESVGKITSLEKLTLSFHRCQLTEDRKIKALVASLSDLPRLSCLDLSFVFCQSLEASTASCIMYYITTMNYLQTASLKFQSCFRRVTETPSDVKELTMLPSNLKKLILGFTDCQGLTGDQIYEMTNLIRMCPNVLELNVNLNWCKVVADKHVQELIKAVSSLQFLERTIIGCQGCYNVTKNSFSELKNLKNNGLKYLDINISYWLGITNKDIEGLGRSLSCLKNLEDLKLSFQNCKDITDAGVQQLCKYFVRLKNLNSLLLSWNSVNLRETSRNIVPTLEKDLAKLSFIQLHSANTKMWIWVSD